MEKQVFDVLIVGCGAVGAAVARKMTLLGQKCIVLEKNLDVLSEASSGNTGHLVIFVKFYTFRITYFVTLSWINLLFNDFRQEISTTQEKELL